MYGDIEIVSCTLNLFHTIGVFKDPQSDEFVNYFLFGFAQITIRFVMGSLLFPFCEYIEEDMFGYIKTPVYVSASIFVHVE